MSDQYTQDDHGAQGENQDLVQERDGKATVLADAVVSREGYEKRTAQIVIAALVFIVVVCFTALAYGLKKVEDVANSNNRVVCNLRAGYQEQLKSTRRFLVANPQGGDILGVHFTADELRKTIHVLKIRIDSTEDATC